VAALTFIFRKLSRKAFQITRTRVTNLNTFLSEHLSGMKVIQIFGREKRKYEEFEDRNGALYNAGFRYFCNVDSNQYFVQIGDDYLRQGRRNLDGYRMYYDLPENNPSKQHLDDLFPVEEVFDRTRPVPVPPMGG
jgi:ABC-type multidrug transport system fused ATPase/permease subunit